MTKLNKLKLVVAIAATFFVGVPLTQSTQVFDSLPVAQVVKAENEIVDKTVKASEYKVDNTFALSSNEGSDQYINGDLIGAHSTANMNASAYNNAHYEKNTWNNAYVTGIIGDGGILYNVGTYHYETWGAGYYANQRAVAQYELAETSNHEQFKQDYTTYIQVLREACERAGLPYTAVVTHNWITQNLGDTDHTDPVAYLASHGISESEFYTDVRTGSNHALNTGASSGSSTNDKPSSNIVYTDDDGTQVIGEDGQFTMDRHLNDWYYAGYNHSGWTFENGEATIHYFGYVVVGRYVYVAYHTNDGLVHYICVRDNGEALGTIK